MRRARAADRSSAAASSPSRWRRPGARSARGPLIEAADRLLPREEPFAGEELADALREPASTFAPAVKATGVEGDATASASSCWTAPRRGGHHCSSRSAPSRTDGLGLEPSASTPGSSIEVDDDAARPRPRLAVRDRRRQRPRAADPHGQVPGADRRRPDHRRQPAARRGAGAAFAARRLHRPQVAATGHTLDPRSRPVITAKHVDHTTSGHRRPGQSSPRAQHGRHDALRRRRRAQTCSSARRSSGPRSASWSTPRRSRSPARSRSRASRTRAQPFPTRNELWLNLMAEWESAKAEG